MWRNIRWRYGNADVETENYVKIYMVSPIECDDILQYINEFDVYINAYYPTGLHSYKTEIITEDGIPYSVVHKLSGKEKYCRLQVFVPIKNTFMEYIEKMYTKVTFRTCTNRNKYILLDFKKPTSLEDSFVYFFRYVDLHMGQVLKKEGAHNPSNYQRLSRFVEENIQ